MKLNQLILPVTEWNNKYLHKLIFAFEYNKLTTKKKIHIYHHNLHIQHDKQYHLKLI